MIITVIRSMWDSHILQKVRKTLVNCSTWYFIMASRARHEPFSKVCPQVFFRFLSPHFFIFSRTVFRAAPYLNERLEEAIAYQTKLKNANKKIEMLYHNIVSTRPLHTAVFTFCKRAVLLRYLSEGKELRGQFNCVIKMAGKSYVTNNIKQVSQPL